MTNVSQDVILASHRLPIETRRTSEGLRVLPAPGGLARVLDDLLHQHDGTWIGYPGVEGPVELGEEVLGRFPYRLVPIQMDRKEVSEHYRGFSNQILWPHFHDLHPYCDFEPAFWETYQEVNRRYARMIAGTGKQESLVWVHDYHLMMVPQELRRLDDRRRLGFFLHIPFPPLELLQRLPWHQDILSSLVRSDLMGFQTERDLEHFEVAVRTLLPDVDVGREDGRLRIDTDEHSLKADVFPISIDAESIAEQASSPEVETRCRNAKRAIGEDQTCIVGVERLDYTKGVPERLRAFKNALDRYPELRGRVTLLQHINPSREEIPLYQVLKEEVERLVGLINGVYGTMEWVPVRYSYSNVDFKDILSLYRLGDVALITPLRDGMNLVCKEYCVAKGDSPGVLVLSRFTGAAEELGQWALLVNPHDIDQMASTIYRACTMDVEGRRRRMQSLQASIQAHDVHAWSREFLEALVDPMTRHAPLRTGKVGV